MRSMALSSLKKNPITVLGTTLSGKTGTYRSNSYLFSRQTLKVFRRRFSRKLNGRIFSPPYTLDPFNEMIRGEARQAQKPARLSFFQSLLKLAFGDVWFKSIFVNTDYFRHWRAILPSQWYSAARDTRNSRSQIGCDHGGMKNHHWANSPGFGPRSGWPKPSRYGGRDQP